MSRTFEMKVDEVDDIIKALMEYGPKATKIVDDIIHQSGEDIARRIDELMPVSGRTFKGHRSSAKGSAWPRYKTNKSLEVTVTTKPSRSYLYFPDDGSNTKHHAGNQQFFAQGLEMATPDILEKIENALAEAFG